MTAYAEQSVAYEGPEMLHSALFAGEDGRRRLAVWEAYKNGDVEHLLSVLESSGEAGLARIIGGSPCPLEALREAFRRSPVFRSLKLDDAVDMARVYIDAARLVNEYLDDRVASDAMRRLAIGDCTSAS